MGTHREAVAAILGIVEAYWNANAAAAIGAMSAPALYFQNTRTQDPEAIAPHARVTVYHSTASQQTMGGDGGRVFGRAGTLYIECLYPDRGGQGFDKAMALAEIAKASVEGKRTGTVWFRNTVIREVGSLGAYFQVNVESDFVWNEIL